MSTLQWPEPVGLCDATPAVCTSTLSRHDKRVLWAHLNRYHPDYAQSLQQMLTDDTCRSLLGELGAEVLIPRQYIPRDLSHLVRNH